MMKIKSKATNNSSVFPYRTYRCVEDAQKRSVVGLKLNIGMKRCGAVRCGTGAVSRKMGEW
jgi:hypothetical protein